MKRSSVIAAVIAALPSSFATAQSETRATETAAQASTPSPRQLAESRLARPTALEFEDQRLEDVLAAIVAATGIECEVMWQSDASAAGLNREARITVKSGAAGSALQLLERVLAQANPETTGTADAATWQITQTGALQVGPRPRLNAFKRIEVYPVRDLLQPRFDFFDAPEIDLDAALRVGDSGGSGAIFHETATGESLRPEDTLSERADELIDLIESTIEPSQWEANGGDGAKIRRFQDSLIVIAPDYIHRQIGSAGPSR